MELLLLAARLVLAAVFAVAGVSKLLDLAGSRRAIAEFGLPAPLAGPAGTLLPLLELATAVLLLPVQSEWAGAAAALVLLALFIAGVGYTMARGKHPDCHCFGQLYSAPVGWSTLVRNALLAAVAGFIVIARLSGEAGTNLFARAGGGSMAAWIGLGVGIAVLLVSGVVLWTLLQVVSQNGRLLTRIDGLEQRLAQINSAAPLPAAEEQGPGLPVGSPAPGFQLPGLHGEVLTLESLRAPGRPVLLSFVDPGCGPCNALLPDLARWQRELAGSVTLTLVSRGTADANRPKVAEHGISQVLLQQDNEVANAFQAYGTPSMVLVRPDGAVGSAVAQGAEQIRALVARMLGTPLPAPAIPLIAAPQPAAQQGQPCPNCGKIHDPVPAAAAAPGGLPVGQAAPGLKLPDLDGRSVDLEDYRGRDVALLFWNPGCGFCQQLLPQLKEWEGNRPAGSPALLVVSTGEKEANAAHGLASTILLDEGFSTGSRFGVNGTPSAVLVDKTGAIASTAAVGGPAVMSILTAPAPQPGS